MPGATIEDWLRHQSAACGFVGSPLYEALLARAALDFAQKGPTWRLLAGHEDDPEGSVLALRMMGAVHRLVLDGRAPELAERYAAGDGDFDRTWASFRATLEERLVELRPLVERPVQTNEVGRCAALLPGFLGFAERTGLPLRLLEVGSSAGLNLAWSDYRYEAGDFAWGPVSSPLRIGFELSGGEMPSFAATVAERSGCDAAPVDPSTEEGRLTLLSYVWPDQAARMERMRAALALAASGRPRSSAAERGSGPRQRLAEPTAGLATVVFHSIVMQYLADEEREDFERAVAEAGARASDDGSVGLAADGARRRSRRDPDYDLAGEEERLLARAGYHGTPVVLET